MADAASPFWKAFELALNDSELPGGQAGETCFLCTLMRTPCYVPTYFLQLGVTYLQRVGLTESGIYSLGTLTYFSICLQESLGSG